MTVLGTQDDWTLSCRPEEDDEWGQPGILQLHAPLWKSQVRLIRPDEYTIRTHAERMQDDLVENILNNRPVRNAINRLYVSKEKVREILLNPAYYGTLGHTQTLQDLWRLLDEEDK